MALPITSRHVGRPADIRMFDGKVYNGRIARVARRRFVQFVYYVFGAGDVTAILDLKAHADRIVEVY